MTNDNTASSSRIQWYRTPLDKETMARLNARSDWKGWLQTGGYLGLLTLSGGLALYSAGHWPWWSTLALIFVHGTFSSTMPSAVHELIHRTVFKTRWLNDAFARFFGFLSGFSDVAFQPGHMLHHQHTLHQPDDLEVVLPMKVLKKHFFQYGLINLPGFVGALKNTVRLARGQFQGEWELKLFPPDEPDKQRGPIRWARTQLIGHALILLVSLVLGWWLSPVWLLLPVLTTCARFYGGWLGLLLGAPQHIGLQDKVTDYRLCCRTYLTNPFLTFLYWHMNYHTEHHMYAAVPCYNLGQLHRAIEHDLPPCPHGLWATWKQIFEIMQEQEKNPNYQYIPLLPAKNSEPPNKMLTS